MIIGHVVLDVTEPVAALWANGGHIVEGRSEC
jgi:hypothetical protein